jgi:nucleoside-diphosphate-sugar epimerase
MHEQGQSLAKSRSPERDIFSHMRSSAKKRGLAFELSFEQVAALIMMPCKYCDRIGVRTYLYKGRLQEQAVRYNGIDRRDNSLGYTEINSVPCCWDCNRSKGALDEAAFLEHCQRMAVNAKVLVLGGSGYLGGVLTTYLGSRQVRVYDSLLYEDEYLKPVPFVYGDVRDYEKLKQQLDWADAVIILSAIVGDGACALNPLTTVEVNYDSVKFITDNFDGRIIFCSTASVYGAQDGLLTEDSPTNPLSLYASTKLKAEILLNNKNAIIFRLGTLFGLGDRYSRMRLDLVVNTLTARAASGQPLKIFGGEQYRPLLHVKDAAFAIIKALSVNSSTGVFDTGIFNLCQTNMKIIDLAYEVQHLVQDTELEIINTKFEDARNYKMSTKKAVDTFGFAPEVTVRQAIYDIRDIVEAGRIKNIDNPRYTNQGFLTNLGNY